jgi:hypothetical protein
MIRCLAGIALANNRVCHIETWHSSCKGELGVGFAGSNSRAIGGGRVFSGRD